MDIASRGHRRFAINFVAGVNRQRSFDENCLRITRVQPGHIRFCPMRLCHLAETAQRPLAQLGVRAFLGVTTPRGRVKDDRKELAEPDAN